jgi:hypothetical protein
MNARLVRVFALSLILLSCSFAQTQGEITGQVTDTTGSLIAGARVTVTNQGTSAVRAVVTTNSGVYNVPSLTPGSYSVRVEAPGFQSAVRNGIELQVEQTARIDFQLPVGQVTEVIEVTGGAPLLNTESATVGTVIENKRIVELPLNGRNFLQMVSLSPNVSFNFGSNSTATGRQGGQRSTENIAVSGQRSEFNYFTLDGINNTDISFNLYVFLPSIDAIQEFKVQTGIFPAEFGRATGQVNVSSKPGTNGFHGTLFEFLRNSALDASSYSFTAVHPPKNPFKRNQYGFTLGGPILIPKLFNGKNRLFFMANYEASRDRLGLRQVGSLPNTGMRSGDFSGLGVIYDPATRQLQPDGTIRAQPFAGNAIPSNRMSARALQLLAYYPTPNVAGVGLSNNYQNTQNQRTDVDQFTVRADFVESAASTWFGRYSYSTDLQLTPQTIPDQGYKLLTDPKQILLSNIRTLSPSVVNEFRFGYSRFINKNLNFNANRLNVVGMLGGIPGVATPYPDIYGIPTIGISGFTGFGDPDFPPFIDQNHYFQWIDTLSITRGRHSLRFGAEVRRDRFNELGNSFVRGEFAFNGQVTQNPAAPSGTGSSFADYLLGMPNLSSSSLRLADTLLRATAMAFFFDDNWKITPRLTLSLGLRYENTPPYADKYDSIVNARIFSPDDPTQHPVLVRAGSGDFYDGVPFVFGGGIRVARDNSMGRALIARDNNDFAPRLGLAYSPTSKWTLRAGFGMFYVQDAGNAVFDLGRNVAGRLQQPTNTNFPDLTLDMPFRDLGVSSTTLNTPYVLAHIYDRRTPYVFEYTLNIQRQLTDNLVLETGYLGSEGHKLQRLRTFNDPTPAPGPVQSRRPWPEFGAIQEVDGSVNSNYNSFYVNLRHRFAHGLTFMQAYTRSRAIDNGSAIRSHGGDILLPQNNYDLRADRGLSNFHVAHRSVTSLLWSLPFGKGRHWLNFGGVPNALLGGWQAGTILTMQTGFPFSVTNSQDTANVGEANYQRPSVIGNPNLPASQRSAAHWFDTSVIVLPTPYTFGNLGRNALEGPGLVSWDFSMMKEFATHEGQHLEVRFESFNFANHPNLSLPSTSFPSASLGTITGTATKMREIQFALKYVF